jgi:hypothetical protein
VKTRQKVSSLILGHRNTDGQTRTPLKMVVFMSYKAPETRQWGTRSRLYSLICLRHDFILIFLQIYHMQSSCRITIILRRSDDVLSGRNMVLN